MKRDLEFDKALIRRTERLFECVPVCVIRVSFLAVLARSVGAKEQQWRHMSTHAAELLTFEALVKQSLPSPFFFSSVWSEIAQSCFCNDGACTQIFCNPTSGKEMTGIHLSLWLWSQELFCFFVFFFPVSQWGLLEWHVQWWMGAKITRKRLHNSFL